MILLAGGLRILFIAGLLAYLWNITKRIGVTTADLSLRECSPAVLRWVEGPETVIVVRDGVDKRILAREEEFQITGVIGMGRDVGNTIQVADPYISAYHARLSQESNGWRLSDLASKNGTWRNNEPVRESVLIRTGDRLRIGETTFVFKG